ncbi:FAD synthetase family protein [Lederbergia sp. NSJ-179]|uniref:FAD synthetase family protein n=1 Tax=Lederbergia sp. NSJ-179 TaxID=2931402 RepID=UPI001FD2D6DF|nr:FAD synthetase family protein [Lederbergia sp. NSJ-179]MCJ7841752.1 FAD synthetase family protein [Lederbergia sp. NSJ-179]
METIYLNRENLPFWHEKAKLNVVALGFFDGIHKGHCKVIKSAAQIAKSKNLSLSVMSFFPHPKTVLSNGKKQVNYLMPLSKKEEALQKLGIDTFYIVEFDKEFASLQPGQFVVQYLLNLGVVHAVAGFDYSYGYKGVGSMDRLKSDSGGLIEVTKIEKFELNGEKVSSTFIREKLLNGDVDELSTFLGHPYEVECDWNGHALKVQPYYTLPAPGIYDVTLKGKFGSIKTLMIVMESGEGHSLHCLSKVPKYFTGTLSIVWHRPVKKVYAQKSTKKLVGTI